MYRIFTTILAIGGWVTALSGMEPQATSAEGIVPSESQTAVASPCAKAIPEYQVALKFNPKDAVIRNNLGICYQQSNRLADAIREYKQATKLNPLFAEAWNNLGSIYHGQERFKDAVKHYRKAIEIKPEMAVAHKNLGAAFFAMGRIDEGIAAYGRAFALNPAVFESTSGMSFTAPGPKPATQYYYFAKVSAASGKIDVALDFLKKARGLGFRDFGKVKADPDFRMVVSDPRFVALTK